MRRKSSARMRGRIPWRMNPSPSCPSLRSGQTQLNKRDPEHMGGTSLVRPTEKAIVGCVRGEGCGTSVANFGAEVHESRGENRSSRRLARATPCPVFFLSWMVSRLEDDWYAKLPSRRDFGNRRIFRRRSNVRREHQTMSEVQIHMFRQRVPKHLQCGCREKTWSSGTQGPLGCAGRGNDYCRGA